MNIYGSRIIFWGGGVSIIGNKQVRLNLYICQCYAMHSAQQFYRLSISFAYIFAHSSLCTYRIVHTQWYKSVIWVHFYQSWWFKKKKLLLSSHFIPLIVHHNYMTMLNCRQVRQALTLHHQAWWVAHYLICFSMPPFPYWEHDQFFSFGLPAMAVASLGFKLVISG